jgi:uncharacterized protein (TIGR00288 family)
LEAGNSSLERQIAVLIDFENAGLGSVQWLFDQISDIGRIIIKRAYADWSTAGDKRDALLELGIEPIHLFRSGSGTKNSSDIQLVIDAIEIMHQSPVDTFVIVSSDSDFAPLVRTLRASGKLVIGAGYRATASRALVISCDRYYYLDQPERKSVSPSISTQVEAVLSRAVEAAMDEQGRIAGSKLNETIQRIDPSFNYRSLGFSTFTKFIESISWLSINKPLKGDTTIELVQEGVPSYQSSLESISWEKEIDKAWQNRASKSGDSIPGPTAANDVAIILKVKKLKDSRFKTLQKLLDTSDILRTNWIRKGNTIIKK